MSAKKVLVILAGGAEEMETVISVDVLRRAGLEVVVAGLAGDGPVSCSRGVTLCPDTSLAAATADTSATFDCVLLPGGGAGAAALCASAEVGTLLEAQDRAERVVAAICAAPTALASHKIGAGRRVTSYPAPAFRESLVGAGYQYQEDAAVVVDGHIVTSRGPGTSFQFALELVKILVSEEKSKEVAAAMLVTA